MKHLDVLHEIKNNDIKPVYLLYGEESYLTRQVEEAIINAILGPDERDMNLTIFNQDPSVQDLTGMIETIPFMGGKNVIVVRGTALLKARKGNTDSEEQRAGGNDDLLIKTFSNMPEYSHVVLSTTEKVDKRRKLFKIIESGGRAVEMLPLKLNDVKGWLNGKLTALNKKMAPDAIEHLLGALSLMPQISLGFLDNELEKLALYSSGKVITLRDAEQVLASIPEVSVFAMIDALSQKQTGKALELLNEQLAAGDHPLRILALLVRQVRMLWQAKELGAQRLDSKTLAALLGVPPFIGEKIVRQSRNFSASALKQALLALAVTDFELKVGKADRTAIEKIIIEMCI
ncbi:putative protein YqeN [bioreactor metagenome]|uniref:DNA polymerase III subunit delta n=1 Tax=bioreactor metagenome TaxID=1076179 RepID=A0A644T991_9ZZZZ|nr:DNA polymerase III subunit delta [Negativicutes bacterium]